MLKNEVALVVGKAKGALGKGRNDHWQALDENRAWTGRIGTDEFAKVKTEADRDASPGTVSKGAAIVSMDADR